MPLLHWFLSISFREQGEGYPKVLMKSSFRVLSAKEKGMLGGSGTYLPDLFSNDQALDKKTGTNRAICFSRTPSDFKKIVEVRKNRWRRRSQIETRVRIPLGPPFDAPGKPSQVLPGLLMAGHPFSYGLPAHRLVPRAKSRGFRMNFVYMIRCADGTI